jgi:predicted aconitase with swiveling domain
MTERHARPAPWTAKGRALSAGTAHGEALVLDQPLSFWGGLDPTSGEIIDRHHPQAGQSVAGKVLVMESGRGSSSSSTVLAEALRAGNGPVAILLREPDEIIVVGALVIELLGGPALPIVQLASRDHRAVRTGDSIEIEQWGHVTVRRRIRRRR